MSTAIPQLQQPMTSLFHEIINLQESPTYWLPASSPAYDTNYPEQTIEIFGELEQLPIDDVPLVFGDYTTQIVLTEESFHGDGRLYAGNWAAAPGALI